MRVAVVFMALLLAGCFYPNQAYDTLYTLEDETGRIVYEAEFDLSNDEPTKQSTFEHRGGDLGFRLVADLFPDEVIDVTVRDGERLAVYQASHGTDSFTDVHVVERLSGAKGTWRIEVTANEDLFRPVSVEFMAPDGVDSKIVGSFQEDRDHHFLRLTGTLDGFGGDVDVRVIDPDGKTLWSRGFGSGAKELSERLDAQEGEYRVEVDPGDWTGWIDLRVLGVFQGNG